MNKQEAIQRLKAEAYRIEPGQEFEIRRMEPEDAWGVARCFFIVYGEHYPFDAYYVPEKLIEENRRKNVFSVVARTVNGDIIGYGALYKSSAYNPKVYEFGQVLIIPEYRSTFAVLGIQDHVLNTVAPGEEIDEIFGEPVCNHIITQKLGLMENFIETGLEVGLMPRQSKPGVSSPPGAGHESADSSFAKPQSTSTMRECLCFSRQSVQPVPVSKNALGVTENTVFSLRPSCENHAAP